MERNSVRAGGDVKKQCAPPPPAGVHPRYVPKRGAVLKGIVRRMLSCFLSASPPIIGPANSSSVRPAPAGEGEGGGDGAEQGK
jgi:hypothetical protein